MAPEAQIIQLRSTGVGHGIRKDGSTERNEPADECSTGSALSGRGGFAQEDDARTAVHERAIVVRMAGTGPAYPEQEGNNAARAVGR
jgi:hypothetical protein